jgi:hypothetical protein
MVVKLAGKMFGHRQARHDVLRYDATVTPTGVIPVDHAAGVIRD